MTVRADEDVQQARRSAPGMSRWMLLGGAGVLFLIVMLAASVAGHPSIRASDPEPLPLPTMTPPTESPGPRGDVPLPPDGFTGRAITAILAVLVAAAIIAAVIVVIRALLRAWRDRPLRRRDGTETETAGAGIEAPADAAPDAPAIRRGVAAARTAAERHPDPGDAIVAAWVGLEETATDSGIGRGRSETPSEFTLRILLRRPGIDEPARELLRLYEGVRFGGRIAGEAERMRAVQALARIEEGWR